MIRNDMKAQAAKRLVFVLGMHRSGTSAVTRGLQVLGVDLGDRLMPPVPGNNEKGFFEDIDANALNVETMRALGREWDSLEPIDPAELEDERLHALRPRFASLLRRRFQGRSLYGMKDPRTAVLLPLWKQACEQLGIEPIYVVSTRHPLSVAESLAARDGIAPAKSHYLWLDHVASAVLHTANSRRVVVSYDLLMKEPEAQLRRVARVLDLAFDPAAYEAYAREFLSHDLRHSVFEAEELERTRDVPAELVEAHVLLERLARDEVSVNAKAVREFFLQVKGRLLELRPLLGYAAKRDLDVRALEEAAKPREERVHVLDTAVADLERQVREGREQIRALELSAAARDGQIHGLNLSAQTATRDMAAKDAHIQDLDRALAQREARVQELMAEVAQRGERSRDLEVALAARDGQIHGLNLTLLEKDVRIQSAQDLLAARDQQLAHLSRILEQREEQVRELSGYEARGAGLRVEIEALNGALAERDVSLAFLNRMLAERDESLRILGEARQAAEAIVDLMRRMREGLVAEAARATAIAAKVRRELIGGAAQSLPLEQFERALSRLGLELAEIGELPVAPGGYADYRALGAWSDRLFALHQSAWEELMAAGDALSTAAVSSTRELEIARLRLLDSLREASRRRAQVDRELARVGGLQSALAAGEAELRQRERELAQPGHRLVTRLGRMLDAYPAVRSVVTAPRRFIHWIMARA